MDNALGNLILTQLPVSMAFYDLDYRILWANRAYEKMVGLPLPEIVGKVCHLPWGFSEPCRLCPVRQALETRKPAHADLPMENQKEWHHPQLGCRVQASLVHNASGEVLGVSAVFLDLTDHIMEKRRQEKTAETFLHLLDYATIHPSMDLLREFLDKAEALTESAIGFYHFVEEDQKTLSLQMWSSRTGEVCTAPGAGLHYPIEKAGVWVDCVHARQPVLHNNYPALAHKKGLPEGHAPLIRELVVPVIRKDKLVAILGVGNKKTDYDAYDVRVVGQLAEMLWETVVRKRAEEENEKLQARYAQAQKTELVGRLAGGVAHDFNNMLGIIMGHVDLALEIRNPPEDLQKDLLEIRNAAERSASLTRQLLAFARQQTIDPRLVNLNELISQMLKMLRRLIGEDIDLVWLPAPDLGLVRMDPTQTDQILANLCVNARDAIHAGGKITIETHNVTLDEGYCRDNPEFRPGAYVMLAVSDNGCGMDRETQIHIFEPFFTTKKDGKGTGLGLATIHGIVRQNHGFIHLYSEPGQGSTFKVYLPRFDKGLAEQVPPKPAEEPRGHETILLVEDETTMLNLCTRMLQSLGYEVLPAESPADALQLSSTFAGKIDLVLSDVVMPGMNGRELSEALQRQRPGLRTLYMSGYTANVIAHHGVLKDGIAFIQKPFSRRELSMKIREALMRR